MKLLILFFLLTIPFNLFSQDKINGHYRDHFGSRIQINPDNTFKYTWAFDLSWSWTNGTWTLIDDTVFFKMIPTYDTISIRQSNGTTIDTLILSNDETPERLKTNNYIGITLPPFAPWGQHYKPQPEKMIFKNGRLYGMKNGRLTKKKQEGYWTKKKFRPWYFKDYE
jgi:hypothetical protein